MADERDGGSRYRDYESVGHNELTVSEAQGLAEEFLVTLARLGAGEAAKQTELDATLGDLSSGGIEVAGFILENVGSTNGLADHIARVFTAAGLIELVKSRSPNWVLAYNRELISDYIKNQGVEVDEKAMLDLAQTLNNYPMGWLAQEKGEKPPIIVEFGQRFLYGVMTHLEQCEAGEVDSLRLLSGEEHDISSLTELQKAYRIAGEVFNLIPQSQNLFMQSFICLANRQTLPDSEAEEIARAMNAALYPDLASG